MKPNKHANKFFELPPEMSGGMVKKWLDSRGATVAQAHVLNAVLKVMERFPGYEPRNLDIQTEIGLERTVVAWHLKNMIEKEIIQYGSGYFTLKPGKRFPLTEYRKALKSE